MAAYTPLAERLGEEDTFHLIGRITAELTAAINAHEGSVHEFSGDGIMAIFGAPQALEDAPLYACRAALEMQARLGDLGDDLHQEFGVRPAVRIGIHTGPVIVGRLGDDEPLTYAALGDTVNVAARLQALAEAGRILISAATQQNVDGYVDVAFAGERELRGRREPLGIYHLEDMANLVTRFDAARNRGLSTFVGRGTQLDQLRQSWRDAKDGEVRVVNVIGEAGIGKSRLVHEFLQEPAAEGVTAARAECKPGGTATPLLPFANIVRASFRIGNDMPPEAAVEQLREGLDDLGLEERSNLPYLAHLLGLPTGGVDLRQKGAEMVGARIRRALRRVLFAYCEQRPVIILLEDLHWLDSASHEYLRQVLRLRQNLSLLVICTFRPEYQAPWADWQRTAELNLPPLSTDDTAALLQGRLGMHEVPGDMLRQAIQRSDGNPLFAEEFAGYLADRNGTGGEHRKGGTSADGPVLPATLENLLLQRVSGLEDEPRALLQAASVVGRRFSAELASEVAGVDGAAPNFLAYLQQQELIFKTETSEDEFVFKHALVREVVYGSLLRSQRENWHAQAAEVIEREFDGRLTEVADILANHFQRSARPDRAVRYVAMAGSRAAQMFSIDQADLRFSQAAELIEAHPGCVSEAFLADMLNEWLQALGWRTDYRRMLELTEHYRPRVESLGEGRPLSRFLSWQGEATLNVARFDEAIEILNRALAIGTAIDDHDCIGHACVNLMWTYSLSSAGRPADAVDRLGDRVLATADGTDGLYLKSLRLVLLSLHVASRGYIGKGRDYAEQLQVIADDTGYPPAQSFGLIMSGYTDLFSEDYQSGLDKLRRAVAVSGGATERLAAESGIALAQTLSGEVAAGHERLSAVRQRVLDTDYLTLLTVLDLPIGVALAMEGRFGEALGWLRTTIDRFSQWGDLSSESQGHFVVGEFYLQMILGDEPTPLGTILRNLPFLIVHRPGAARRAARHYRRARQLAEEGGAPGTVAQALLGLGRLAAAKGDRQTARDHLEEAQAVAAGLDWPWLGGRIDEVMKELE